MKPGRDLDLLVSERVFGMKVVVPMDLPPIPPKYSTDHSAAWQLREHLRANTEWDVIIYPRCVQLRAIKGELRIIEWKDLPFEHAICLAALQAFGVQIDVGGMKDV
jgi:hypothetical protein